MTNREWLNTLDNKLFTIATQGLYCINNNNEDKRKQIFRWLESQCENNGVGIISMLDFEARTMRDSDWY